MQALLSSKQAELEECRKKVVRLEGQLRVAQRDTSRAASIKLKQVLHVALSPSLPRTGESL